LSKQFLRSGTAIDALVREDEHTESRANFIHKMGIALKEANETEYWIELLFQSDYIDKKTFTDISADNLELLQLLVAIVKSMKTKGDKNN
jgi:four helix bundle protein